MTTYDLVFEGGGAKGMVFAGALQAFEEAEYEQGRLMGTSAGSITAVLLAAGYMVDDILPSLSEKLEDGTPRFATFMGVPESFSDDVLNASLIKKVLTSIDLPLIPESWEGEADKAIIRGLLKSRIYRHIFSFEEAGGLYSADAFVEWLIEKLDADGRNLSDKSLAQFHEATGRHLTVIAADITEGQMLVLNHNTAPDLPVVMAVRMSMSVPLLWQEVIWQASWGTYRGDDIAGHAIVDGGLVSNFPIELFLSTSPHVVALMGEPSEDVLGFLIDEKKEVPDAPDKPGVVDDKSGIDLSQVASVRRIAGLANTMSQAHDKFVMRDYKSKVVRLPAKGYGTTEFDMTDERREALIRAGYDVTKTHFETPTFETGLFDQEAIDDVAESMLMP